MAQPVSYFYFKLNLEIAHVSTYGRDEWVKQQYQKYLIDFNNTQKKREDKLNPPKNPLIVKKANNPNTSR